MIYITKDGLEIITRVDDKYEDDCVTFKVNLPKNKEDESTHNGEGVWARCHKEDYYMTSKRNEFWFPVMILNDSFYWPNLKYKNLILIKFKGFENIRPVAVFDELKQHYGEPISDEEYEELLIKVMQMNQQLRNN